MVAKQLFNGDAPPDGEVFMLAWFGVWTVGGGVAIYAWLWQLMGKEILAARGQTLTVRRDIGGFGLNKEYSLIQMRDLRIRPVGVTPFEFSSSFQLWGVGGGVIAFDHGERTYRFGAGLDETEAKQVVTAIKQRFRIPESSSASDYLKHPPYNEVDRHSGF